MKENLVSDKHLYIYIGYLIALDSLLAGILQISNPSELCQDGWNWFLVADQIQKKKRKIIQTVGG